MGASMAWLRITVVAVAVAFALELAAALPLRAEVVEEVPRDAFRNLERVAPRAFHRYRGIVDPLGQLDPFVSLRGGTVQLRYDRSSPWRTLVPAAEPISSAEVDPLPADAEVSLSGLRVALDPGHRGGAWSREERRHITVGPGPAVREGDLTHAVAVQLAAMLRERGAEVWITRGAPPARPFPQELFSGYDAALEARQWASELQHVRALAPVAQWQDTRLGRLALPFFLRQLPVMAPFELYNRYELRRRSELAAELEPHVTLSLHFNVARDPLTNGIIVFLLGNFVHNELNTPSQRYYALRALTSGELEHARPLAISLGRALQRELGIGPLSEPSEHPLGVAKKIPIAPEDGVFARNLALLRRTPGIVLLVEGPCMNAVGEFERLQQRDTRLPDGTPTSSRTTQYARAVLRALLTHADALRSVPRVSGDASASRAR